jgi:DNA methylase
MVSNCFGTDQLTVRYKRASLTETPLPLKGADWLKLNTYERKHVVEIAFRYWRRRGFPYYRLTTREAQREFHRLFVFDHRKIVVGNKLRGSNLGLRLANFFQPGMWSVRVSRYRSPMDVFQDDGLLRAAIERAFVLWPMRYSANASCLRRILKTFSSTASVSNFQPVIAKAVIATYSKPGDVVVDFCAGYGGRLLGCLTMQRKFIGIEPCKRQVHGLNRLIQLASTFNAAASDAKILHGCAEDRLKKLPSRSASLVFSSPPYFDWERYALHSSQSFIRYRSYPEWLEHFLKPVIAQCSRVLTRKGYLILNVSNGKRNPTRGEVLQIAGSFGFAHVRSYRMILAKVPYLHPRNGVPEKSEYILVFSRRRNR